MFKKFSALLAALALTAVTMTPAQAADLKSDFKLTGIFKTWSINQNDFRAGKDDINDWYTVSLVRLAPTFSAFDGDVAVNMRMDLAQGWWGIDEERGGFKNLGGNRRTHSGNNGLFNNKDTNYGVHVDEAWLDMKLPFMDAYVPTRFHIGRFYQELGGKLVLDYEVDGIRLVSKWNDNLTTTLGYSIMSEGYAGLSDNLARQNKWDALQEGQGVSGGGARLWFLQGKYKLPNKLGELTPWFMAYQDDGTDDGTAYLNDDIDYSDARFHVQIGTLFGMGLGGNLKLDGGNISLDFQASGLVGKDPINNQTYNSNGLPNGEAYGVGTIGAATTTTCSAATAAVNGSGGCTSDPKGGVIANQTRGSDGLANTMSLPGYTAQHFWNRLDKNDGDINGWNFLVTAKAHYLEKEYKVTPALVVGAGSGDEDKSGGNGNVNKLITEGWWYICEVWEDSIMPDLTGITPQGLGSPWSRGYRELENQVLVQPNLTWTPHPKWKIFTSYTYVHAVDNIYAWEDEPTGRRNTSATVAGSGGANASNDFIDAYGHKDSTGALIRGTGTATTYGTGGYDTTRYSKDIGHEIDWDIEYTIFPKLVMEVRGGYFFTGDAASYLIAGAKGYNRDIYELRWDVTYRF